MKNRRLFFKKKYKANFVGKENILILSEFFLVLPAVYAYR